MEEEGELYGEEVRAFKGRRERDERGDFMNFRAMKGVISEDGLRDLLCVSSP